MRRSRLAFTGLGFAAVLTACGSVRTELPRKLAPGPTLEPATPAADLTTVTVPGSAVTTASAYKSAGEKHGLAGGTLAASYPRVGVQPPKGAMSAPAGQAWAVVNARFCATAGSRIEAALVDPVRFRVEVPGQGQIGPAPNAPALTKAPLTPATADVPSGTCIEGSIAYLVAGEGHIESISYDTGAGLLRWAT